MQRNFIVFIILSGFILAGWYYVFAPTETPQKKIEDKKLAAVKKQEQPPQKQQINEPKKIEQPQEAIKQPPAKEGPKGEPILSETLGGEGFHLAAVVTTRGAGVRSVTLNRFKAANWLGQPTDQALQLIQDDPFSPSFRMYHYEDPQDDRPVFGLGEKIWKLEKKKSIVNDSEGKVLHHEIQFSTTLPGHDEIVIKKTYRLEPRDYHLTLLMEFENKQVPLAKDAKDFPLRYQLTGAQGLPIEGEWYTSTFRNSMIGLVEKPHKLWRKMETSDTISVHKGGDRYPPEDRGPDRLQYAGVVNQYFGAMIVVDDKQPPAEQGGTDIDKILAWARPTWETAEVRGVIISINEKDVLFRDATGKEFRYILLPRTKQHFKDLELGPNQPAVLSYYETFDKEKIATWVRLGETLRPQFDDFTVRVNSEPIVLQPGKIKAHQFLLYHGPVKAALLAQFLGEAEVPDKLVTRYTDTVYLYTLTDYHSDNLLGKISYRIQLTNLIILCTTAMHWLLNYLHYVFGYGLSIVVLTVIVRGAMFPISRKQAIFSMKMQELAPEMKKIKDQYKDDPAAQMRATLEFQKKHGINPLGSCWPLLLQMPIFLGLYFALQESIHFRLANFLWIQNLAAPDMLIYWGEGIPVISSPDHSAGVLSILYLGPFLNVLPIFAAVMMLIQQIQTMPPPTDEQQAMQQNMMRYMMIFFGIMFYKVAAGLCIYFITSSLWGMAERKLLPKKKANPEGGGPVPLTSTGFKPGPPPIKGKGKPQKKEKEEETILDKISAWWKEILKQAEKK